MLAAWPTAVKTFGFGAALFFCFQFKKGAPKIWISGCCGFKVDFSFSPVCGICGLWDDD